MIELRVMPSRMFAPGGVLGLPFFTTNRFSPVHSATKPRGSSMIASSPK